MQREYFYSSLERIYSNVPRAAKPKSDRKTAIEAAEAGERPVLLEID